MTDTEFDTALITAAFRIAADEGWRKVTVADAARSADLPLPRARDRFPAKPFILLRFASLVDQAALADAATEGSVRDRLFDLLMCRFDAIQAQRDGVIALLRALPSDPATALMLGCATHRGMRWMLQAAGIPATGPRGALQVKFLLGVWLWGMRAWEKDETEDLSGTMAAVDKALERAEQVASWLSGTRPAPPPPPVSAGAGEDAPFVDPLLPDPEI